MSTDLREDFEDIFFNFIDATTRTPRREPPKMIKKLVGLFDSYFTGSKAETQYVSTSNTVPHTKVSVIRSASADSSPSHAAMPRVRSDPNTLPHKWTVSSHGTLENLAAMSVIEMGPVQAQDLSRASELITATGHHFKLYCSYQPTYCDFCGGVAYGSQLHRCMHCYTTTHPSCSPHFQLSCQRGNAQPEDDLSPDDYFETARDLADFIAQAREAEGQPVALRKPSESNTLSYTPSFRISIPSNRERTKSASQSADDSGASSAGSSITASSIDLISPHSYSLSSLDVRSIRASGINVIQKEGSTSEPQPQSHATSQISSQLDRLNLILGTPGEFRTTGPDRFRGSLRVHMNLLRPVKMENPDASVFLPRGNACLLHSVTSDHTSRDVIGLLLAKHRIRDPIHKFGLFEHRVCGDNTVQVRRLPSEECPLRTLVSWASEGIGLEMLQSRRFILQENEDLVDWMAFSQPELQNFIRILDIEEEQYMKEIQLKYELKRKQLQRLLWEHEKEMLGGESEA